MLSFNFAALFALDAVPSGDAPFVSTWAGLITVCMTTVGAIILALIKRDNRKTNEITAHISHAVNGIEPGEDTLIQRVTNLKADQEIIKEDLHDYQHWMGAAIQSIGKEVGVIIPPYKLKERKE